MGSRASPVGMFHVRFTYSFPGYEEHSSIYNILMPSGVSSVGISGCFAGLGYLSLYLAGKLSLFDRRGYSSRVFFVLVPHLVSVLIAISRVNDYQHRWVDVLGAAVIGKDFSLSSLKKCI